MEVSSSSRVQRRVGLVYDERMCKHSTPGGEDHPETPDRIRSIWNKLQNAGIPQRCVVFSAKEAEDKHLMSVHSKRHVEFIKHISSKQFDSRRQRIAMNFNSIYLNKSSSEAAYLAAGSLIEVAERVAGGELDSAFAFIRPPGHHAEQNEPMGFCIYNNVAVATKFLLNDRPDLGIKKILIVDWDVHHGNGTQKMFWEDGQVLFFSVHRHEFGTFYPANDDGSYTMIGEGQGKGFNINVPWENGKCGDADYIAVWDHILIPVAKEFNPDLIIISAGFDAAVNDPLGGCCVTPYGYSILLRKLMGFARGKIVMALEGGYNLESLSNSVLACVEVLLQDTPVLGLSDDCAFESTWRVIQMVRQGLCAFWPSLADELPKTLISNKSAQYVSSSESEDELVPSIPDRFEDIVDDLIRPLSEIKVTENTHDRETTVSTNWRTQLSKVDVWYSTFGSNMLRSRFLCYVEGGQVEGMEEYCAGSMDKTPPKQSLWKVVPHRLFFGRNSSHTWGPGGVAFLNPKRSDSDKAYMLMYKITLEQFNDVLALENHLNYDTSSPLFDLTALDAVANKGLITLGSLKENWYESVLYMGKEHDVPILTMTCSLSDVEDYKAGRLPSRPPCKKYADVLVKGLVEGNQLSEEEARAYIDANSRPL